MSDVDNVLYEYTMTYPLRACKCGSRMVRHVRTDRLWWFACSVCKAEITRDKIVELDHGCFARGRSGMDTGGADSTESDASDSGSADHGQPLQAVAPCDSERVE